MTEAQGRFDRMQLTGGFLGKRRLPGDSRTRPTGFEPVTFGFVDRPLVWQTGARPPGIGFPAIEPQAPVASPEPIGRSELGATPNCLAYSRLNWLELS
jgi:hypothetical protein